MAMESRGETSGDWLLASWSLPMSGDVCEEFLGGDWEWKETERARKEDEGKERERKRREKEAERKRKKESRGCRKCPKCKK